MKRWDVVLVAWPFSDLTAAKKRPAVVLSPEAENKKQKEAVFAMITSNTDRQSDFDVAVEVTGKEFVRTGLKKASMIRPSILFTLDQNIVVHTLGQLGPELQSNTLQSLKRLIGAD